MKIPQKTRFSFLTMKILLLCVSVLLLTCNKGGDGGEVCDDGVDNDGDGNTDCWDPDCGFEGPSELSCADGADNDCDGNADCWDDDCGFEGAVELTCNDGIDNDCDGNTDEWDPDCEGAGCTGNEECNDFVWCNGEELCVDGTCTDGMPPCSEGQLCDEENHTCSDDCTQDNDADGYCAVEVGGNDCDDWNAAVHPDAVESECNGLDDNCDGALHPAEDADGDGFPEETCCNAEPMCTCVYEDVLPDKPNHIWPCDCDDSSDLAASTYPGAPECVEPTCSTRCVDHDLNCDGEIGADMDGDHHLWCLDEGTADWDCDDDDISVNMSATEDCGNEIDDDCDTLVDGDDDGCTCTIGEVEDCYTGPAGTEDYLPCREGSKTCTDGAVGGDCEGEVTPRTEVCGGGEDEDCDGKIDGADESCECTSGATTSCYTGPGGTRSVGVCRDGTKTCSGAGTWGSCVGQVLPTAEVCDGRNNDCDGSTDENDGEHICPTIHERCITNAGGNTACRLFRYWSLADPELGTRCYWPTGCICDGVDGGTCTSKRWSNAFSTFPTYPPCNGNPTEVVFGPYISLASGKWYDLYVLLMDRNGASYSGVWGRVEFAPRTVLITWTDFAATLAEDVPYYAHVRFHVDDTHDEAIEFRVWLNTMAPVINIGPMYLIEGYTTGGSGSIIPASSLPANLKNNFRCFQDGTDGCSPAVGTCTWPL